VLAKIIVIIQVNREKDKTPVLHLDERVPIVMNHREIEITKIIL
jgi:hypothetical protein